MKDFLKLILKNSQEDQDQLDYVDSLRDACVNAYTGILQAARPADNEDPQV